MEANENSEKEEENPDVSLAVNRPRRSSKEKCGRKDAFEKLKDLRGTKRKYEIAEVKNSCDEVQKNISGKKEKNISESDWIVDNDHPVYVKDGKQIFDEEDDNSFVSKISKNIISKDNSSNSIKSVEEDLKIIFANSPTKKIKTEETNEFDSKEITLELIPSVYSIGDLVWVYIKGNPLWPSILTCPNEMNVFSKIQSYHKVVTRMYHVLFLNDNGKTLWVNPRNMVPFEGKEKLVKFLDDIKETEKEKKITAQASNPMLKTFTMIQKTIGIKFIRWQEAIKLADKLVSLNNMDRIENIDGKFNVAKRHNKLKPRKKKVKRVKEKLISPKKKECVDIEESEKEDDVTKSDIKSKPQKKKEKSVKEIVISPKKEDGVIIEESENEDDFLGFDNVLISEGKMKQKKLKEKITHGFDVYLDKHLQSYMDKHKEIVKEKVVKILYNLWKSLTHLQKNRYRLMPGNKSGEFVFDTDYSSDSSCSSNTYGAKKLTRGNYKIVPRHEKVCHKCNGRKEKDGSAILRCKGACSSTFHLSCLDLSSPPDGDFKCVSCLSGVHGCFICKSSENKVVKCTVPHCGKYYHYECARKWPQVSKTRLTEKLVCPRHMCHMCAAYADDMNDLAAKTPPFTKCLLCPTTYHTGEACIAAGVEEITQQYHICTKHLDSPKGNNLHCNVNWCFCCSKGGSLLLCDQCPAAFHAECLNITAPEGDYVCEDCENGKFPIYGDVVWVKLGSYRWWPGQVMHPKYIPDNIEKKVHAQGMFCVHFFGSDDYYWVSKGRVFLYQEGDQGSKGSSSRPIEQQFRKAMFEAVNAYREQKKRREEQEATRSLNKKPPPYVRIETNKPVGNVRLGKLDLALVTKCECGPFSQNPCGSDDKCLNRMLMVECVPQVCAGGERCNNQRFQKRQYPSIQPFRTSARGWGLKTNEFIQKSQFIIEYVGELVDEQELKRRIIEMHNQNEENYYFLTIDKEHIIDAGPKGNMSRFMNHSCQPNCETQKWTVGADTRVGLFALEDIVEGSELTFNYNLECVGTDKKKCQCGASQCSGFIGTKVQKQEKSTKADSLKKKKRKRKKDQKDTDDECFRCGGAGDLVLCDLSMCPKGYHLDCLNLKTLPKGKWICPWHHCDECGSRALNRCISCPNSYCKLHSQNRFYDNDMKICLDHDYEEIIGLKANGLISNSSSSSTSREQTPDAHLT